MIPLTEQYNFEKFWNIFTRQDRHVSKWDEGRTDQDVFIRRTLQKWFVGKCFQVLVHQKRDHNLDKLDFFMSSLGNKPSPGDYDLLFTKYVHITNIYFKYSWSSGRITFYYVEPHSQSIQEEKLSYNDFIQMQVMENQTDFAILRKFYPVEKKMHPKLPQIEPFIKNKKQLKIT